MARTTEEKGGLRLSLDRKTKCYPTQRNTFGLLPGPAEVGGTCPYSTRNCGGCFHIPEGRRNPTCYAYCLMKYYKGSRDVIARNTDLVRSAKTVGELQQMFVDMVDAFRDKALKYAKTHSLDPKSLLKFRWHWTGDVESERQARAMSGAMRSFPDIQFWTYTRSFRLAHLLDAPNLILYLSVDDDNWEEGLWWFCQNGWHREPYGDCTHKLAYMGTSRSGAGNLLLQAGQRPEKFLPSSPREVVEWALRTKITSCPVDGGSMEQELACSRCRQCTGPGRQLLFFQC